jgi:2-dehydropantoate 2-reductase
MHDIKTIWVIGLGGVGGYFGGLIAYKLGETNDQRQVYFMARGQHLREIQENGLILQRNDNTFVCRPTGVSETPASFPEPDLCLVCTKSYDLEGAILSFKEYIRDDTIVIPLLNGLDIYQRARKVLDKGIIMPACVYITSFVEKPGKVAQKGPDGRVALGPDPQFPDFDLSNLLDFSLEMGLNFEWKKDPYVSIWEKYLLVGSFALVTAATGLSFGEVASDPDAKASLIEIMREIILLGQKQGIDLNMDLIDKTIAFIRLYPFDARSSFQRDLEQGRSQAEGDIFGGTIIRMGRELNLPTPVTERMVQQIEERFKI